MSKVDEKICFPNSSVNQSQSLIRPLPERKISKKPKFLDFLNHIKTTVVTRTDSRAYSRNWKLFFGN